MKPRGVKASPNITLLIRSKTKTWAQPFNVYTQRETHTDTQTHTHTHTHTHPVLHSRLREEGAGLSAQKPQEQVQPNVKQAQSWVLS